MHVYECLHLHGKRGTVHNMQVLNGINHEENT